MKVGDCVVWIEVKENIKIKGIVIDSIGYDKEQNITIQWDVDGINTRTIIYHISQIQDEKRIQIDKEYYRELKLNELGI